MPCKCNLDKFNEKANEKAVSLAHDIYNCNGGYEEDGAADAIFQLLKESYLAGYRQCEEDFKIAKLETES